MGSQSARLVDSLLRFREFIVANPPQVTRQWGKTTVKTHPSTGAKYLLVCADGPTVNDLAPTLDEMSAALRRVRALNDVLRQVPDQDYSLESVDRAIQAAQRF
ncbi:hypothetical protein GCM10022251_29480 [Phytohabitans flavus]|uniref:Uncharacterized protein n=1 Tax=Phytohabitans flavus TaxID=1076124 RepID=A0A6F8XNM4_9ACTN|nr:hypothetical protein [Phytohabitans flavus]BCB75423.1 hypothetical protein Pflav_018330 [Phytohabitans flavus]